jgi:hypothetical protein
MPMHSYARRTATSPDRQRLLRPRAKGSLRLLREEVTRRVAVPPIILHKKAIEEHRNAKAPAAFFSYAGCLQT